MLFQLVTFHKHTYKLQFFRACSISDTHRLAERRWDTEDKLLKRLSAKVRKKKNKPLLDLLQSDKMEGPEVVCFCTFLGDFQERTLASGKIHRSSLLWLLFINIIYSTTQKTSAFRRMYTIIFNILTQLDHSYIPFHQQSPTKLFWITSTALFILIKRHDL